MRYDRVADIHGDQYAPDQAVPDSTSDLSQESRRYHRRGVARRPVTITQRNKPRLVLLNINDYERLMRQSDARSVGTLETMPHELLGEFEAAVDTYAETDETS